jgi:hypothetical protein
MMPALENDGRRVASFSHPGSELKSRCDPERHGSKSAHHPISQFEIADQNLQLENLGAVIGGGDINDTTIYNIARQSNDYRRASSSSHQ